MMKRHTNAISRSQKFYDRFSWLYPLVDFFLRSQKQQFFDKINSHPCGRLLEIGVGNGAHFKYYQTHEIIGIDTSESMLDQARKRFANNIQLIHMTGENLLFQNNLFDYVVLSHVIAVVEDPEKLLAEVARVLKPHGKIFILNHFTPNNHLKYLDKIFDMFSGLFHFKSMFKITSINAIQNFNLLSEFNAGLFSYFKILIYEKNF